MNGGKENGENERKNREEEKAKRKYAVKGLKFMYKVLTEKQMCQRSKIYRGGGDFISRGAIWFLDICA